MHENGKRETSHKVACFCLHADASRATDLYKKVPELFSLSVVHAPHAEERGGPFELWLLESVGDSDGWSCIAMNREWLIPEGTFARKLRSPRDRVAIALTNAHLKWKVSAGSDRYMHGFTFHNSVP